MAAVEVQNIHLAYDKMLVAENVSFKAESGAISGLIGPNGSGKSTIIKALCRFITPSSGKILLDGRDIGNYSQKELATMVSVVPQFPLLPSLFTAYEIVLMGRNPHMGLFDWEGREDHLIARRSMEMVGISTLAPRRIGELSGGEIQCVVIARALAQGTRIILLDEPTSNLDIGREVEVLDLLKKIARGKGVTIIMALHDLNLAAQYCDQIILLNKGRIYKSGQPEEVITGRTVKDIYGAGSIVFPHPLNKKPTVIPVAGTSRMSG